MPTRSESERNKRVRQREFLGKTESIILVVSEDLSVCAHHKHYKSDSHRVHHQVIITDPVVALNTEEVKKAIEAFINPSRVNDSPDLTRPVKHESVKIEWLEVINNTAIVDPLTQKMMEELGMITDTCRTFKIFFTVQRQT